MPTLLVHFISDFLRDPEVRSRVLKNEDDGGEAYGLSAQQIAILKPLDKTQILAALYEELEQIGVDIPAKKAEVYGGGGNGGLNVANLYSAGSIHPRKAIPSQIPKDTDFKITIAGNGFDPYVAVRFDDGTNTPIPGKVVAVRCDVDLYQRVEVEVKLPAGTYTVQARNTPDETWTSGSTGNPQSVQVTAA